MMSHDDRCFLVDKQFILATIDLMHSVMAVMNLTTLQRTAVMVQVCKGAGWLLFPVKVQVGLVMLLIL